jgi:hypothetical protein
VFSLLSLSNISENVVEEQVTSYPKSADKVEKQCPVETCVLLVSTQLLVQELSTLENHLTS